MFEIAIILIGLIIVVMVLIIVIGADDVWNNYL